MAEIRPQAGAQEKFLSTRADIAIYGGAAGGGKSWGLLLEPLRHSDNKSFHAVIFRRTCAQITNPGGLWDESSDLYIKIGARSRESSLEWTFRSGATLKFAHMQHEKDKYSWQGGQVAFLGFDELTHFSKSQFFYMLSRNRSTSGIRSYIRATTNPDSDSWVAEFIGWWIDQDTGFAIPERSGVLRWFMRDGDNLVWGDSREELVQQYPGAEPLSVTFISASIFDNKILMEKDPGYLANLKAMPRVERERLLGGNWKIRPSAGLFFKRIFFEIVDAMPASLLAGVRYWDRAATEKREDNNPDWTAGLKMSRASNGFFYIEHVSRFRGTPLTVETAVRNIASGDGDFYPAILEQDPGQAGKVEVQSLIRSMAGYDARAQTTGGKNKIARAGPLSAQAEAGNVKILRGSWNEDFLDELEGFPDGDKDDQVDAASGAFNFLAKTIVTAAPVSFDRTSPWKI